MKHFYRKICFNTFICRLFHRIETIENGSFIDRVTNESVGRFSCKKCNIEYLANSKRNWFRCLIPRAKD